MMRSRKWYELDDDKHLHRCVLGSVSPRPLREKSDIPSLGKPGESSTSEDSSSSSSSGNDDKIEPHQEKSDPTKKKRKKSRKATGGTPIHLTWYQTYWRQFHWYLLFLYDTYVFMFRFFMSFFCTFLRFFMRWDQEKSVQGDIIVVTGAASGLGKCIALKLAMFGANVMCLDINKEKLDKVVLEIGEKCPKTRPRGFVVDVTDRTAVLTIAGEIKTEIGNVTMLVNCACVNPSRFIVHYNNKEINKVIDVNLKAQFWTLEAFLPHMKEKTRGHLVYVGSIASRLGSNHMVPICATSFGAFGMMEALECDLRFYDYDRYIKTTCAFTYYSGKDGPKAKPRIIFPNWMKHTTTEQTADAIVHGILHNRPYIWVPFYTNYMHYIIQLLPRSTVIAFKDYMEFTSDPYDHRQEYRKDVEPAPASSSCRSSIDTAL